MTDDLDLQLIEVDDEKIKEQKRKEEIMLQYNILDEKCQEVLDLIYARKNRQIHKAS